MPGQPARSSRRSSEARERLLSTALRLFYENGVNRVGVDWVIEESGVALATFYRHFPSKEDLVVACVRAADEARRATVEEIAGRGGSPEDRLRAWVEAIGKEIAAPGFRGCPFINAAAEYPARDSPVRKAVEDHRKWFKRSALSLSWAGPQLENQPIEAKVEEFFDVFLVWADAKHRDGKFLAAGLHPRFGKRFEVGGEIITREIDRHPSVAILGDAIERLGRLRTEDNRRSTRLLRFGKRPDRIEVHELAVKLGRLLGPYLAHRENFFLDDFPAPLEHRAMILHLLDVPARADAEDHAAARNHVERRHFFGERDRVALDHQAYSRAEFEFFGYGGRRAERDERIVRMPVLFWQFGAAGEGRLARRGYVSVLGKEHRLEAAFFSRERKLDRLDCVVSREHRDSEFGHAIPPGSGDNGLASAPRTVS